MHCNAQGLLLARLCLCVRIGTSGKECLDSIAQAQGGRDGQRSVATTIWSIWACAFREKSINTEDIATRDSSCEESATCSKDKATLTAHPR